MSEPVAVPFDDTNFPEFQWLRAFLTKEAMSSIALDRDQTHVVEGWDDDGGVHSS